jgi:AcrR family transcriptional regulator
MPPPSRLRADAARNRESLLAAATQVFASADGPPTMRAIASEAGVGVGTLYRHFPTLESLVDAVYQDQAERLSAGAHQLLEQHAPADALRQWMDLFGQWLATKRGMLGTLLAANDPGAPRHPHSRAEMLSAITAILDAGAATGELRTDVDAEDVAASLVGIFIVAGAPARRDQAARLLDLLMDALAPPHP